MRARYALVVLLSCLCDPLVATADEPLFRRDVRPILSDKCFQCHGPDEAARQAGLRLDISEEAAAVLEGTDLEGVELLRRISSDDPDTRMPPPDSKLALTAAEIETLTRWVELGAAYEQHWSFRSPQKPRLPEVRLASWPRNSIDYFVLADLERLGFAPSPPADRETLIRRVTFDLTGLPPTLAEIDAFLSDQDPRAYERLVDRLLDTEGYGERMAVDWLDVARYSDTYGYQVDRDRFVWPWRDWVVRSFNSNLAYDEFLRRQLAGDLLPGAGDEEILATTFNRLHPQKVEGGSVPEEFRVEYVADRTHTFTTAFLGLTFECARCHDHKFDPFTQREYYQLFAFFNNIDEAGLYSYFTAAVPTPTLLLQNEAQRNDLEATAEKVRTAEDELRAAQDSSALHNWLDRPSPPATLIPGQVAHLDFEADAYLPNRRVSGKVGHAVELTGDDEVSLEVGNFGRQQPFSVALWMYTPDRKQRAVIYHRSRAWTDAGSRGYQLLLEDGRLSASLIHFWPGNAIRVRTREPVLTRKWLHVAVTYDGSSRAEGLRIHVDGQAAPSEIVRDHLYKNITGGGGDHITIGARFRDRGFTNGRIDEFRVFARELTPLEIAHLYDPQALSSALQVAAGGKDRHPDLAAYYLSAIDTDYQSALQKLEAARKTHNDMLDGTEEIMVMRERPDPRATFVLRRGAYDQPQQRVHPATPAVLPAFPARARADRLGLAEWLVSETNPLTARVAVNRLWTVGFGYGLVRTPEDFGNQGEDPTHPELLDWLACEFVEHGWDMKRLLKQIVTSATYRQQAVASGERWRRDPGNRLLARGPRYRMAAEMLRDNALAVSGLLVRRVGGPPAKPYDLAVSFKPLPPDDGSGLYRRSLYTFWKRTAPSPVMMTLDAAKRDVCTVKRERTASPLQAFVLMNDPQFVEAARVTAVNLTAQHGEATEAMLVDAFRLLTSRRPDSDQLAVLRALYREQLQYFETHPDQRKALLANADRATEPGSAASRVAAATMVVSTLMNFDLCITKR